MSAVVRFEKEEIIVAVSDGQEAITVSHHPVDSSDRAAALAEALKSAGVGDRKYLLALSRRSALFREFDLPFAEPEELRQMVRFQLERDLPLPPDEIRYSWTAHEGEDGKLRIQAVAVPRADLDPLLEELGAAGLSPEGATVSVFGLTAFAPSDGESLVAALTEKEMELAVVRKERLLFSRSAQRGGDVAEQLAGELDRTVRSFAGRAPDGSADRLVLALSPKDDPERLTENLSARLGCPVTPQRSEAASLEGLLRNRGSIPERIPDLLHPPSAVRGFKVTRWQRISAVAGLILVLVIGVSQCMVSSVRGRQAELEDQLAEILPQVEAVNETLQRLKLARNWGAERFSWIDFLDELSVRIDSGEMVLLKWDVGEKGNLLLSGKMKNKEAMNDLLGRLKDSDWFTDVTARGATLGGEESGYGWNFRIEGQVAHLVRMNEQEEEAR